MRVTSCRSIDGVNGFKLRYRECKKCGLQCETAEEPILEIRQNKDSPVELKILKKTIAG